MTGRLGVIHQALPKGSGAEHLFKLVTSRLPISHTGLATPQSTADQRPIAAHAICGEVASHKQTVKNNNIDQQQKDVSDRLHESYQSLCLFRTNVGPTWGLKGFRIITQTFSGFIALESIMSCFSLKHFYTSIQSCSRYTIMNISYSSSVLLILFI